MIDANIPDIVLEPDKTVKKVGATLWFVLVSRFSSSTVKTS